MEGTARRYEGGGSNHILLPPPMVTTFMRIDTFQRNRLVQSKDWSSITMERDTEKALKQRVGDKSDVRDDSTCGQDDPIQRAVFRNSNGLRWDLVSREWGADVPYEKDQIKGI